MESRMESNQNATTTRTVEDPPNTFQPWSNLMDWPPFGDRTVVIVHKDYPIVRLPPAELEDLKLEIARRAILGKNVCIENISSEEGAVVIGCANRDTINWLVTQFSGAPFKNSFLKLGPKKIILKRVLASAMIPKIMMAEGRDNALLGLKNQNGLNTEYWSFVESHEMFSLEREELVLKIDEISFKKLKEEFDMRPYLGGGRVKFKLLGGVGVNE